MAGVTACGACRDHPSYNAARCKTGRSLRVAQVLLAWRRTSGAAGASA